MKLRKGHYHIITTLAGKRMHDVNSHSLTNLIALSIFQLTEEEILSTPCCMIDPYKM